MSGSWAEYQETILNQKEHAEAVPMLAEAIFQIIELERRHAIAKVRLCDRLLGRDQTIPERNR